MSPPPHRSDAATLLVAGKATAEYAATPHLLASHAALEVMGRGGNAIDGAIAANAVQGVVAPDTCGIGGDLFAMVHYPNQQAPAVLNSSGAAGSGVSADELRTAHREMPSRHPWTVTVPGCVAGWVELAASHGALPLASSLGPAIQLATDGFPVSPELAESLHHIQELIGSQPAAAPLYPAGAAPEPGTVIRRPGLGRTLAAIAERGRDAFYTGAVATAIAAVTDGALTVEDLAAMEAHWVEPVGIEVFGLQAWTVPPNSQGYLTLAACWLFEQLAPPPEPAHPSYVHAMIEAYRAVAWERDHAVADPATAPLPAAQLLAPERLEPRLHAISDTAVGWWPAPGSSPGGTAYMCTRDRTGLGVSLIQSNFAGIGSGLAAGDTGIFLHNRGAGFSLVPGHPNELTPGRRPLHTLSPTVWTRNGELRLLLGTRGGQYQPQLVAQVAAHLLYSDAPRAACQTLPRWLVDGWRAGESPTVRAEARTPPTTVAGLEQRGHAVVPVPDWASGWGPVSLIGVEEEEVFAAVDPRVSTSAALTRS